MVGGREARAHVLPALARRRAGSRRRRAGWSSPGCACGARRPSAAPARRGRGRRSARCARAGARAAAARGRAGSGAPSHGLVVADAEPQRAPRPLVERREGPRPRALVAHDPDRHRRRADAGHRADVAVLVARPQRDLAGGQPRRRGVAIRRPALEQARRHQRAALRVADALPRDRRPGVEQHALREPVDRQAAPARRSPRAGARPRWPGPQPRWPARSARPHAPHARSRSATTPASPPPGGRQSTSATSAALGAHARRRTNPSPTLTALTRCSTLALASWPTSLISPPPFAPPRACARSASCGCSTAAASPPTATTPPSSTTATAGSSLCGEAIAPALLAAEPFAAGAAAVATNVADVRAMGGGPAGARRHARQPRPRPRRSRCSTGWDGRPSGSRVPIVGGHLTLGAPPRVVGLLHRHGDDAAARRRGPDPAMSCSPRSASTGPTAATTRRSGARCASASPRNCARTARRSWRSPSAACATPPVTCPCRASRARCCSCSSSRAAGRRSTSSGCRAPTGDAHRALGAGLPELRLRPRRLAGAGRGRLRGLHASWPGLRAVRRLRRVARAAPGRRRRVGGGVGPGRRGAHACER